MNVNELQAGPELDRLIAEKVMGWKWGSNDISAGLDALGDWQEARTIHGPIIKTGGWCVRSCWSPSANIAHAWEVVERITSRHALFVEVQSPVKLGERDPRHYVVFRGIAGQAWGAQAESVPLAICRSALRALAK